MGEDARRPIAARKASWAAPLARGLKNVGLTPNQISAVSVLFAGGGAVALRFATPDSPDRVALLLAGIAGIQLRLVCNLMDGMVAVEGGLRTKSGEVWNDAPDRFADVLLFALAGYAVPLPYAIEAGWLAACGALLTAYTRYLGAGGGLPQDFRGPMAKQHRMFVLTVACVASIFEPMLGLRGHVMFGALALIAAGTLVTFVRRATKIIADLEARP